MDPQTPRTDELNAGLMAACQESAIYNFMLNHARTLELENARLLELLDDILTANDPHDKDGQFGTGTSPIQRAKSYLSNTSVSGPCPPSAGQPSKSTVSGG